MILGIAERGPIADPKLLTSFEDYIRTFGGFTTHVNDLATQVRNFFLTGGAQAWVSRTCHFTDITDAGTYTAAKGSVMLQTVGTAPAPAVVISSNAEPFNLEPGQTLDIDIAGGSPVTATFDAAAAALTDTASYPITALVAETMGITVDGVEGSAEQTITATGGETTAAQVAAMINNQIKGCSVTESGGQVVISTDMEGTAGGVQVTTPGTLNAILGFPTSKATGTGDVADIDAVTGAEAKTVIESDVSGVTVTVNQNGTVSIATVATGASAEIQVEVSSTATGFGFDNDLHNGSDAAAQDTLLVEGKYPGSYTDNLTTQISAATSGEADHFNFSVLKNAVVVEVFPNVTMGDGLTPDLTMSDYVEKVINDTAIGSKLITVTDQLLSLSATLKRPVNGTSTAFTGGDDGLTGLVDVDFTGDQAGETGLFSFDRASSGTLLLVPGRTSAVVQTAMLNYCQTTRDLKAFSILDCPVGLTAMGVISWAQDNGILEASEFGAVYWPRIKVVNPSTEVFGTGTDITVPSSGVIAGRYAADDQQLGGVYEQPAGIGLGYPYGVLYHVVGVEDDPSGREEHEVLDVRKRDLVYPKRINPINKQGGPWFIDGSRTLKSSGNFPYIGERRGVIFIHKSVNESLEPFRHRNNTPALRQAANRMITQFLIRQMNLGAFRSTVPAEAFFVDTSDAINPTSEVFAGRMNIRIGLATNKPAEFIIVTITQDTRALQEQLAQG
jgi:phage tail sheath protein FI